MLAPREHPPLETRIMVALAWMASGAIVVVPLAVTPDLLDRFRVVKESLMRAQGILSLLLVAIAVAFGSSVRLREILRERAIVTIAAAGVLWTVITTLTSTHRLWSAQSLASCVTSILVAAGVCYAAPRMTLLVIDLLVPATLINAGLASLQEFSVYQPFLLDSRANRHLSATGFIGNPNLVGTYLALAAIILTCAATQVRGWRRWFYALGASGAIAGVFISQTRTALIGLLVGLAVIAIAASIRRAAIFAAAVIVVFALSAAIDIRSVSLITRLPARIASSGLEVATSGRVTPALAALFMFRAHPLTGVGPGAFRFQYMPYQIEVRERYGDLVRGVAPTSFSETHNDHLQMLAETGLPGYALFMAAVVAIVACTRRSATGDERARVMRQMVPPLVAAFLVLALAQFPLHVAVTRHLLMTMAGLAIGWSRQ